MNAGLRLHYKSMSTLLVTVQIFGACAYSVCNNYFHEGLGTYIGKFLKILVGLQKFWSESFSSKGRVGKDSQGLGKHGLRKGYGRNPCVLKFKT